ncbi:MAG: metalloregulator ArsR/SmtB family transcription factor [Acidobacteriota bacterium]
MESIATSLPEPLVARFTALADPARLRLLHLLAGGEYAVAEIAEVLQMPQSSVSRHLKMLADQGWIAARRDGPANLYRVYEKDLVPAARRLWQWTREETASWTELDQDRARAAAVVAARRTDPATFFAGVAGEWERLRAELYGDRFTLSALIALLPRQWVVADLACGSGAVSAELAPHVRQVIAVDHSPEMIRAAKRATHGLANVDLRRGELEALPVQGGSCDAALMLVALTHVADPGPVLLEMARVVKPGGRLVIVDLMRHDREDFRRRMGQVRLGFQPKELTALLAAAGCEHIDVRPLAPAASAKGPALLLATADRIDRKIERATR